MSAKRPESVDDARESALRRLTARPYGEAELEGALVKAGYTPEVAASVVARLVEVGLVSDADYASFVARSVVRGRLASRADAKRRLVRAGVDADLADDAITREVGDDEEETARALAEKKARSLRGLDHQVAMRRLVGALARRGFGAELSYAVARDVLGSDRLV